MLVHGAERLQRHNASLGPKAAPGKTDSVCSACHSATGLSLPLCMTTYDINVQWDLGPRVLEEPMNRNRILEKNQHLDMEECGQKVGGDELPRPQLLGSNPGSASWLYVQIQGTFALINKSKIIMFICVVAVMTQTRYIHVSTCHIVAICPMTRW